MAGEERLRAELYAAFKNRALMYTDLPARAIVARGREIGRPGPRH